MMLMMILVPAFVLARTTVAAGTLGFGRPATQQEIAGWDIDVRPDGTGLPPGRGTVAQGQIIYDAKCASCHGTFGESTDYLPLAGGVGTLSSAQPVRTTGSKLNYATTLFDYIRRAMPFNHPKTLTNDEVYALTAYVLNLNDILPADAALDRESLPRLKLPNRDGFTTEHGLMAKGGKPDTHNVACMRNCAASIRLSSEIPEYARDAHGDLADQMRALGPVEGTRNVKNPKINVKAVEAATVSAATSLSPANAASAAADGAQLAKKAGCMACHAIGTKVVGPSFKEVRARYADDAGAERALVTKIRAGGAGAWGAVPMPPQSQVGENNARSIVQWIRSGNE